MPMNDAAASGHVCPGIRIPAIDTAGHRRPSHRRHGCAADNCQRRAGGEEQRGDIDEGTMGNSLGSQASVHAAADTRLQIVGEGSCVSHDAVSVAPARLQGLQFLVVPAYQPHREFAALLVAAFGHQVEVLVGAVQRPPVPKSSEYPAFRRDHWPVDVHRYG
jgi:hypothetical protein